MADIRDVTENPLESIFMTVVFSSRDFDSGKDLAWICGVICGWGDAIDSLASKYGWDESDVERITRLHSRFTEMYQDEQKRLDTN